jgi:hypothetical protein
MLQPPAPCGGIPELLAPREVTSINSKDRLFTTDESLPPVVLWASPILLSPPQCHAVLGTIPHTLASVETSTIRRSKTLTPSATRTPRVGFWRNTAAIIVFYILQNINSGPYVIPGHYINWLQCRSYLTHWCVHHDVIVSTECKKSSGNVSVSIATRLRAGRPGFDFRQAWISVSAHLTPI